MCETAPEKIALNTLWRTWQALYATRAAHLYEDECGAPELFSGGCKMISVDELPGSENAGKMDPGDPSHCTWGADRRGEFSPLGPGAGCFLALGSGLGLVGTASSRR